MCLRRYDGRAKLLEFVKRVFVVRNTRYVVLFFDFPFVVKGAKDNLVGLEPNPLAIDFYLQNLSEVRRRVLN